MTPPSARSLRLLACLLLLGAGGPARAAEEDFDLADWPAGPIRYVAQAAEIKTFRKLKTDADRALFIDRFWARRDPSPETLANEYRQIFWERVRAANDMFLDSSKPGWKTDRGKIYILYGPPTKIEEDLHVQTDGLPAGGQGLIRWVYEGRPGDRMDLNPIVVVAFVRDAGGEFRVSYDPGLTSIFFDAAAREDPYARGVEQFLQTIGTPARSELSVMLDLGRMQEVPPQAQVLIERVETVESYGTRPLHAQVSRFVHPDRAGTLAVVTVDVSHVSERSTPSVLARFTSQDDPGRRPVLLGEDSFRLDASGPTRLAQGRTTLDPGRWLLTVVVVDPESAATGLERIAVEAGARSEDLRLSDVTWARLIEPVPYASLASHDEAFLIGPFRVLPRLDSTFRRGETLRLFFEAYGGRPPYRVTYQVEGLEDDGSWTALGQPSTGTPGGTAQGFELPTTEAWPVGEYRMRIAVADDDARAVAAELPFHIAATEPGDPPL